MQKQNKGIAVVTGASSGIGYELARQFAQNGFDLIIAAEDAGIAKAASLLKTEGAISVEAVQVDLSKPYGVETLYDKIAGRGVEAIAINAGIGVGGDFTQTDLGQELTLVDLNVRSTVHLAKLVLPDLIRQGMGRILFTSSIAADMPAPFEAVYGASKAFIQSFAEALRNEVKDSGVTITSLQPGATETNFFHRADMDDTKVGASDKDDAAEVAKTGFEALMAGKDHVVAGSFKNKVFSAMGKLLPETVSAQQHRGMSEPGSAGKQ